MFILKIEKPFSFMSQIHYRNENQNFISNFAFQFIEKNKQTKKQKKQNKTNEMALWVHGFPKF